MKLKHYTYYGINFLGKWCIASGVFMGVSFFLRILYYFFLNNITAVGTAEMVLNFVIPCLLCAVYIVLLSCIHWNAPGVYGILACVFFLFMIGTNIAKGGVLQIILSVLWYLITGAVLLATAGGYLPGRLFAVGCVFLALVCRVVLFNGDISGVSPMAMEASNLAILASLTCSPMAFEPIEKKMKTE